MLYESIPVWYFLLITVISPLIVTLYSVLAVKFNSGKYIDIIQSYSDESILFLTRNEDEKEKKIDFLEARVFMLEKKLNEICPDNCG